MPSVGSDSPALRVTDTQALFTFYTDTCSGGISIVEFARVLVHFLIGF